MKINIELNDHDTEEVVETVQRLVAALEKLVDRLEDIVEPPEDDNAGD